MAGAAKSSERHPKPLTSGATNNMDLEFSRLPEAYHNPGKQEVEVLLF